MGKKELRIVYMGTPEFAVPSLQSLYESGYQIVAVITAPDKPSGRGLKMTPSPVKVYAEKAGLKVLQPERLRDSVFQQTLRDLKPNLGIVVAFRMLPESVWGLPELGTFNLHASLLPQYRGAAPINWAVINGEKETGLTTFFLKHEIDTGDLLLQKKEPIYDDDNAGSLYNRLMTKGADLVLETVRQIENDAIKPVPQVIPASGVKTAPKIFREDCEINWDRPARAVYDFVRGLAPYPGGWCHLNGRTYKILETKPVDASSGKQPGTPITDHKKFLNMACSSGSLMILKIQPEGKKAMSPEEFFRGNKLE